MPLETPVRVARELASRGYNAEREAVTLLANAPDPEAAVDDAVAAASDDALTLSAALVRSVLDDRGRAPAAHADEASGPSSRAPADAPPDSSVSTGTESDESGDTRDGCPVETMGVDDPSGTARSGDTETAEATGASGVGEPAETAESPESVETATFDGERSPEPVEIAGDVTGASTGTGEYRQFVSLFRDRYERLSSGLRSRVNHRPTDSLEKMSGGSEAAVVGLVNDVRSTASGHWLVELEDTNGVFPCLVLKDRDVADLVDEILLDEVLAIEGTLSDDGGILFADAVHFPDVPHTHEPDTADRHVQAALVSDVHVGSDEFVEEAWHSFAEWLHTDEAAAVEYLLVAGDMVEGVGVYPGQDEELSIVDIYDQYEQFSEYLKEVPGDLEIAMIPGNHDAVRLAEPQPAFDEELRDIMSVHDATVTGNPSTVTVEGVDVLMYHGVSLDHVIAELPAEKASYDEPHRAMFQLLKKRHVAPTYGAKIQIAPEESDYLVVDDIPDVFHTGHVHKLGVGKYHDVVAVNSGCWQAQTDFQKSVNIDPDFGYAPILDLDTLDVTVRKFS